LQQKVKEYTVSRNKTKNKKENPLAVIGIGYTTHGIEKLRESKVKFLIRIGEIQAQ
jgi:hypothetical protein